MRRLLVEGNGFQCSNTCRNSGNYGAQSTGFMQQWLGWQESTLCSTCICIGSYEFLGWQAKLLRRPLKIARSPISNLLENEACPSQELCATTLKIPDPDLGAIFEIANRET